MYTHIFFDLDGTLTDSSAGIFHSLRYALSKMGAPPLPPETEKLFIGPPLQESFTVQCGYDEARTMEAIRLFREYYLKTGIREVLVVPGMEEALRALRERGLTLAVTSSKEQEACRRVVENLGLTAYFDAVMGASSDLSSCTKADVIRAAMAALGLGAADRNRILLVGDRKYDVLGAAACGIPCLGLDACGFAPAGELEAAGAAAVVHTPGEMADWILAACRG